MPSKTSITGSIVDGFRNMGGRKEKKSIYVSHTHVYEPVTRPLPEKEWTRREKPCCSTPVCLIILAVSFLLNVALVIAFLLLTYGNSHASDIDFGQRGNIPKSDISDSVCVSCDSLNVPDVTTTPLMTEVKVIELESGSRMCCLRHSESLQSLVKLVVSEYYGSSGDDNRSLTIAPGRTSAHLFLDTDNNDDKRMDWTQQGKGVAHVTGNVDYRDGRLRVREDGIYFLYSLVTLKTRSNDTDVVHCIQRYNEKLPHTGNQLLLISKVTLTQEHEEFKTSFLAANLKLRQDDEIFVEVSDHSFVYKFTPANFFGLYKL